MWVSENFIDLSISIYTNTNHITCCFAFMKVIKKSRFLSFFGQHEFLRSPIFSPCLPPYAQGCKHNRGDQTSAPVYESRGFIGQKPISSSEMLFKID